MFTNLPMSTNLKFAIPLVLGALAALVNWWSMSESEFVEYISVNRDVIPGQVLRSEDIQATAIPKNFQGQLDRAAVPFSQNGVIDNNPIQRKLTRGDLLTFRDLGQSGPKENLSQGEEAYLLPLRGVPYDPEILFVGDLVSFVFPATSADEEGESERIGPFRIVSIGASFTRDQSAGGKGTVDQIGIAVPQLKENPRRKEAEKLLRKLARSADNSGQSVFLVLHPDESAPVRPKG